ncbi:MAG: hypothetical protein LJE70_21055 [Chromatiaceae bacterium]|nr:hypothetical protein [Chromatiaceae bacterium]
MSLALDPSRPEDAFAWVERWSLSVGRESVPLTVAGGRVLARELSCLKDIPAHASCACAGYALQAADTTGAGAYNPLPLLLEAEAGPIEHGRALRVADGDPLPAGADAVLLCEQATRFERSIEVTSTLAPGDGVLLPGMECRKDDELLQAHRRLRPQDLALLGMAGVKEVQVRPLARVRVTVAHRSAADVLIPMLTALIGRDGGSLLPLQGASQQTNMISALREPGADLILVAGGTGYEEDDNALQALQHCGEIDINGVCIHPGTGTVLGQVDTVPVALLPGSALACLCAYDLIAARLLRRLSGKQAPWPYRRRRMALTRKLASAIGRLEVARVAVDGDRAEPIATAEGRVLSTAVRADGFVLIPAQSEGYAQESLVDVHLYDEYD